MKISIFGMGYVGIVSSACLVRDGHQVMGVDPVASKVEDLNKGQTPIQEPGVSALLSKGHANGLLSATTEPGEGISGADMIWICVATPSLDDGGINLSHVKMSINQIGNIIKKTGERPLIVVRSTVLPGSNQKLVIPTLEEASGLKVGKDIHVVFHPEFLREATAVYDFDNPPKIVVGETTPGCGRLLLDLYKKYKAPKFSLTLGESEMVKYSDNLFHAVKITFANELGAIAHSVGVDARRVSEVFCSDRKLNISPYYLRPGFAYGGSCLPKDLRAILRYASLNSIDIPMLNGMAESNQIQIDRFINRILAFQPKSVGMVGLAFKKNTDDMRESPFVTVAKRLIGEGLAPKIFDPFVNTEKLIGSNKEAVTRALGHLQDLLVDSLEDLNSTDLILVNHSTIDAKQIQSWIDAGIRVIDLASIKDVDRSTEGYEGIAW